MIAGEESYKLNSSIPPLKKKASTNIYFTIPECQECGNSVVKCIWLSFPRRCSEGVSQDASQVKASVHFQGGEPT